MKASAAFKPMASYLGNPNLMQGVFFDQTLEELFGFRLSGQTQSEKVFIGIKNEKQAFLPKSLPESGAPAQLTLRQSEGALLEKAFQAPPVL